LISEDTLNIPIARIYSVLFMTLKVG
jgi:hypothetical protein